jgi:hypothetical protein
MRLEAVRILLHRACASEGGMGWRALSRHGLVAEGHDENQLRWISVPSRALSRERERASGCRVRWRMTISFARHQFPPAIIRHAVWLYMRFTLSYRDVEDLLAERGPDISYETVRRWVLKFGPLFSPENFGVDARGQPLGGISMRWPQRLRAGSFGCGARLTTKVS